LHMKSYYKEMLITAALAALTGELYFYPFGTNFRFTVGVITLSFLVLYFYHIPEIILIPFSGLGIVTFRILLSCIVRKSTFMVAFNLHYPALFFYLAYAVFLKIGKIKALLKAPVNFIAVMTLADIGANFVELTVRHEMNMTYFQEVFNRVLGVGLIRSIITLSLYWLIERYRLLILREEHEKRYAELMKLLSELKAEFFYIKKSSKDLEDAMREGYHIYQSLALGITDDDVIRLKKKSLNLARDIHEIKKDYLRIMAGVKELLPEERGGMKLAAVLEIIKSNTQRLIRTLGKDVELKIKSVPDLVVINYFSMFSILNNLVSNALDALDNDQGVVEIEVSLEKNFVIISVSDNGKGIDIKDLPYIFEPGFSTKYSEDGLISTGLGMVNVKNLIEDMKGRISVVSARTKGTNFKINLPLKGNFTCIQGDSHEFSFDDNR
jgi:two-component system sensor histidine kinase YcbA